MPDFTTNVLHMIALAKKRPELLAQNPMLLDQLADEARSTLIGRDVTLTAPVAIERWEAQGFLANDADQSAAVTLKFPMPVEIVGMFPTVRNKAAPDSPLIEPDLDDLLVSITANSKDRYTVAENLSTNAASSQFNTLSSIGVQAPTVWMLKLQNAQPELTFIFRWWRPPSTDGVIFKPCLPAVTCYCRYPG